MARDRQAEVLLAGEPDRRLRDDRLDDGRGDRRAAGGLGCTVDGRDRRSDEPGGTDRGCACSVLRHGALEHVAKDGHAGALAGVPEISLEARLVR